MDCLNDGIIRGGQYIYWAGAEAAVCAVDRVGDVAVLGQAHSTLRE